jgi:hypothetical protein
VEKPNGSVIIAAFAYESAAIRAPSAMNGTDLEAQMAARLRLSVSRSSRMLALRSGTDDFMASRLRFGDFEPPSTKQLGSVLGAYRHAAARRKKHGGKKGFAKHMSDIAKARYLDKRSQTTPNA